MLARVTYDKPLTSVPTEHLAARTSVKWKAFDNDVLPMFIAEMDVNPAPAVVDAVTEAVRVGDLGYPMRERYPAALADFTQRRYGWSFDTDLAVVVGDVMSGAMEALRTVVPWDAPVVVTPPVYEPFFAYLRHAGHPIVEAPLGTDGRLDLDALERAFASATRAGPAGFLLCNPHNPTGVVHTREELLAVSSVAHRYGVRVVADEIHAPLVYADSAFVPYLTVDPRGVAVHSASKGFNLAGLKCAVMIFGGDVAQDRARVPEVVEHASSHFGVLSHVAALQHGDAWLDALLHELDENRQLLDAELRAKLPEVGYRMPQGTYLGWLDCRGLGLDGEPGDVFLERGRVAFSRGPWFGTGGAGFVRFNLATHPDRVVDAVDRMAASVGAPARA